MSQQDCSLVISTYNWPQALELCLLGVLRQTVMPGEIVIADDGSSSATRLFIETFRGQCPVPIKQVWHADNGFQKTIILNEAVRNCANEYIIQIDGDIIIDPNFISDHITRKKPGFFLRGSRTLINESATKKLIQKKSIDIDFLSRGIKNRMNGYRNNLLSSVHKRFSKSGYDKGILGCNFSYFKQDFIDVNGYNNDIVGWGQEDSELGVRLMNNGIRKLMLKYKAVCFHLHHHINSRDRDDHNKLKLREAVVNNIVTCANGYSNPHPVQIW